MNNAKNIFRPGSIIGAITVIIAGYAMDDTANKFFDTVKNMNDDFSLGVYGILNMPFLLINVLALVFALIGLIGYKRWGMLTAGILYSVSGIIWFTWLFYAMPQGILAFVAFSRMVSPEKAQQQKNYRSEPERELQSNR